MRANKLSRAVLAWATALAVTSLLFLLGQEAVRSSSRRIGFMPVQGRQGVRVTAVNPGEPAERAGLQSGDEILAADGRTVRSVLEYQDVALRYERGRPVGNYAISIAFSDGHGTGIYRYEFLREICPCPSCGGASGPVET